MLLAGGILVGGGLLTYAGLSYFGFLESGPRAKDRTGLVKVPKSQRNIRALSKVIRDDFHNLELGDDAYYWYPQSVIDQNPDWILDTAKIANRVMARNKAEGYTFTERDFLPEGSRTGISAGVPEGKQGFFVDAEAIPGLELLKMGDKFDLLSSLPEEALEKPEAEYGLLAGGIKVRGGKPIPLSGVRQLVQDAQMIAITRGREMTTQSVMSLPEPDPRSRNRNQSVQITIAIDPKEVVPLTQALAAERTIHCVAQSGQQLKDNVDQTNALVGLVPFPATARSMEAFSRITADDLADPDTGELRTYYFRPEKVGSGWINSVNDLIGRVVARDTTAGFIFSQDDFLPNNAALKEIKAFTRIQPADLVDPLAAANMIGRVAAHDIAAGDVPENDDLLPAAAAVTAIKAYARIQPTDLADPVSSAALIGRVAADDISQGTTIDDAKLLPPDATPGIAGGTPSNRMAISVDAGTVKGITAMARGDRFDLMASVPFKPGEAFAALGASISVSSGAISQSQIDDRAKNTVLAEGAIVVDPGEKTATIAVRPDEVAAITKAITLGTSIFALTRSGRSDTDTIPTTPGSSRLQSDPDPIGGLTLIEEMVGGERRVRVFAKGTK